MTGKPKEKCGKKIVERSYQVNLNMVCKAASIDLSVKLIYQEDNE